MNAARKTIATDLDALLSEVRACELCKGEIPEPRPVLRARPEARILLVGQAPGTRVHATGVPWNDASGKRLREWLAMSEDEFYDDRNIAIIPMGFCYPGKGKSGDLPPRPECAPTWHARIRELLPNIGCTLLIGQYAQRHYLEERPKSVADTVRDWRRHAPETFVLPHPSPRNQLWLRRHPWFEEEVVPHIQRHVRGLLDG